MLTRALSILIIGFWLIMIGLLVRKELGPGGTALREVPVGHVIKLLLMHGEASDLNIFNDKLCLGHLHIHPHMHKDTRSRVIDFVGHLQILVPGMERQRVAWDGELELEKDLATRRFTLGLTFRDPTIPEKFASRLQVTISPVEKLITWTVRSGDRPPEPPVSYSLDEAGMQRALRELIPDQSMLQMFQNQTKTVAPPVIRAHQSHLLYHGQRLDTYLVTVQQSGQTLLEFDVTQLGTIVRAKTITGYSLSPDDAVP